VRIPRVHHPEPLQDGQEVTLTAEAGRHLLKVLRLQPGAPLVLFDGSGREYPGELREGSRARLGEGVAPERESPLRIHLLQGVSKGERMDYTLQKAVELGVNTITPVVTERSVVQLEGARLEKRMNHWRGIIIAACEQSGRNRVPDLQPLVRLPDCLAADYPGLKLVLDPEGSASLSTLPPPEPLQATLLIGPEGGLSDAELAMAGTCNFTGLRLGPRILRTETAGLAAIAALQSLWGDLG